MCGALKCAFLIQNLHTFFILSVWKQEEGYLDFGGSVTSHVDAAARAFAWVAQRDGKPEVWSTQWQIWATSQNVSWVSPTEWASLWPGGAVDPLPVPFLTSTVKGSP